MKTVPQPGGMEEVHRFEAGKNSWNTFVIGIEDGRIVIKDDTGHLEIQDGDVDDLYQGIDEARRRLREMEREPTGD